MSLKEIFAKWHNECFNSSLLRHIAYIDSVCPFSSKDEAAEFNLTNACNVDCGCQDYGFSPVCSHNNVQFFSACHAGCRNYSVAGDQKVSVADESKVPRNDSSLSWVFKT